MDDVLLRPGPLHDAAVAAYQEDHSGPVGSGCHGGIDPFQPTGGRPHFELDFVCMFGSAFQWHFPMPKEGQYVSVVVDCVRTVSPPW